MQRVPERAAGPAHEVADHRRHQRTARAPPPNIAASMPARQAITFIDSAALDDSARIVG
jgi:hypothetical protein